MQNAGIDRAMLSRYRSPMHQTTENAKFLRAAVKAGLRMQSATEKSRPASDGVATLQKIKASLRKSKLRKQL